MAIGSPLRNRFGHIRQLALASSAAATLAIPAPVFAQFAGTPVVDSGVVFDPNTGQAPTAASNIFVVGSDFAQITWTPAGPAAGGTTGGTIDFLPEQNAVAFWDGDRFGDFTVLNRIINLPGDSRRIAFNGSVSSFVGDAIGGTVWFYSPSGILVGPNAFMDVGNLLLSTGAIGRDDTGIVSIGNAAATIENRGLLDGTGYVALVAPTIVQAGTVQAGRTAALVAADSASLTIRETLFDIEVTVAAQGGSTPLITHSGLTQSRGGSPGDAASHRVYMVAVSRNDALGILLGGTAQATGAVIDGNAVVLAAGSNIVGGEVQAPAAGIVPAGTATGIVIDTGEFPHLVQNGSFTASSTGDLALRPNADIQATGWISLAAGGSLDLGPAARVRALGDIGLTASGAITNGTDSLVQSGGALSARAGSNLGIGRGASMTSIGSTSLDAGGSIAVAAGAGLTSSAGQTIKAAGSITFASASRAQAAGTMALAADGSISLAGDAQWSAGTGLNASASQDVTIAGTVRLTQPATAGVVALKAGDTIDVVTPTGSIVLRGANGGLLGQVSFSAPRIVVADTTARAALALATSPEQRLAALFGDGSRIALDGFVAADTVSLTASQAIFVQNTGNDGDFAGVNANSLTVAAASGSFPEVHVFGRSTGTGGIVVANNRLREFIIDRSYPFVSGSSVNNCLLSVASCNPIAPPAGDVVFDGPINASTPVQPTFALEVELARVGDLDPRDLGLLDDPVTGSGDITQWQDTCIEKDGRKCP